MDRLKPLLDLRIGPDGECALAETSSPTTCGTLSIYPYALPAKPRQEKHQNVRHRPPLHFESGALGDGCPTIPPTKGLTAVRLQPGGRRAPTSRRKPTVAKQHATSKQRPFRN